MTSNSIFHLGFETKNLVQKLAHPVFDQLGLDVEVLRLDKIDTEISGNKWFKLKLNLEQATTLNQFPVISFGGAFSNHIHALAAAGKRFGFDTLGVIRGEPEYANNPTLRDAANNGMKLHFVDRKTYKKKDDITFQQSLFEQFGEGFIIPEGGSNLFGVKGCQDIASLIQLDTDRNHHIVMATATGTSFAGLLNGLSCERQVHGHKLYGQKQETAILNPNVKLHGISVLNAGESIAQSVNNWLSKLDFGREDNLLVANKVDWTIHAGFHLGGYARIKAPLVNVIDCASQALSLPLDPIYTGKMFFGFCQLVQQGEIGPCSKVTLIHTGGLQGVRGCEEQLNYLRNQVQPTSLSDILAPNHNGGESF